MPKCPPVPKPISEAGKKLATGTAKEKSKAGKKLKEHQDKKH